MVTGRKQIYSHALSDVRAITASRADQYARFEEEVCPTILGLPRNHAASVKERIEQVVRSVGLKVAKPGCSPNLTLIVADDGRGLILALQKKMPNLFAGMTGFELARLKRSGGPAWSWYAFDPKRRDGGPIERIRMMSFGPMDPPRPVSPHAYIASNVTMSRLSVPVRLDLTASFVVLSSHTAEALSTHQIGDLSAMLGLSMIDLGRTEGLHRSSVLQWLRDAASRDRIAGLTEFDLAYLRALYSGDSGYSSDQQARRIASQVTRGASPRRNAPGVVEE